MRTIAFISQKGGCGKTTSCLNIGAVLAREFGQFVALIDLDSNACASRTLGQEVALADSVAGALLGYTSLQAVAKATPEANLWIVPGSTSMHVVEYMEPQTDERREVNGLLSPWALAMELSQTDGLFDFVLVDCAGGNRFSQNLALLAADDVIIPTGLSHFDLMAAWPTMQLVEQAIHERQQALGDFARPGPRLLGLLPNGSGKHGVGKKVQRMVDEIQELVLSPIRRSELLKTITTTDRVEDRLLVWARPDHPASQSYRQVAREILLGVDVARQASVAPTCLDELGDELEETVGG